MPLPPAYSLLPTINEGPQMTLTLTPEARRTILDWLADDPSRPALRIIFAGGCGALGYRMMRADRPMPGDTVLDVDGLAFFLDYKSQADLDGARIEAGEEPGDLAIVHDQAVVGGSC